MYRNWIYRGSNGKDMESQSEQDCVENSLCSKTQIHCAMAQHVETLRVKRYVQNAETSCAKYRIDAETSCAKYRIDAETSCSK